MFRETPKESFHDLTFLVLLQKVAAMEFLENLSPSLFTLKNVFLVKNNGLNLGNIYFPIDSQVFTFQPDRMDIKIFEVYKIASGLDQIVKKTLEEICV